MDAYRADLACRRQADVRPCASLIGALVDAVSVGGRLPAHRVLARPDVEYVHVGRRHGDRADGVGAEKPVGNVAPAPTCVVGTPESTARITGEIGQWLRRNANGCRRASSSRGPKVSPGKCAGGGRVEGRNRLSRKD